MTAAESRLPLSSKCYNKVGKIKSVFWKNFFVTVMRNDKAFILTVILNLLGMPCLALAAFTDMDESSGFFAGLMSIGIMCFIVSMFMGFIFPRGAFPYLTAKTKVDMHLSLPLSTKKQFFSNFFSGLSMYTVPYIIASAITMIIYVFGLGSDSTSAEYVSEIDNGFFLFKLLITVLVIMVMFYCVQVFVLSFCGTSLEEKLYTFVVIGLVPTTIAVFLSVMLSKGLFGINDGESLMLPIFTTSPIGGVIYLGMSLFSLSVSYTFGQWLVPSIISILVYFALSFFYYTRRKAEDVAKPIIFMSIYNLLVFAALSTATGPSLIYSIDSDNSNYITTSIVITAIVYFLIEIVRNRGFRNLAKSALRYVVCLLLAFGINALTMQTRGFGIERYVPVASSVSYAAVSYNGLFEEFPYSYFDVWTEEDSLLLYKSKDTVKTITKLHGKIVDDFKKYGYNGTSYYQNLDSRDNLPDDVYTHYLDTSNNNMTTLNIMYKLYNGQLVYREYEVPQDYLMDLNQLVFTEEFINRAVNELEMDCRNYDYPGIYNVAVSSKYKSNLYTGKEVTSDFIKQLRTTLIKDVTAMTEEAYETDDVYCYLGTYDSSDDYYPANLAVRSSWTNTINLLNEFGLTLPNFEDELMNLVSTGNREMRVFKITSTSSLCIGDGTSNSEIYFKIDEKQHKYSISSPYSLTQVAQISQDKWADYLKSAQAFYYTPTTTDKDYYVLQFGTKIFYLPDYSAI